jgi:hypothetical protein
VPELAHKIPSCGAFEEGVHDFGLRHAWELRTALGEGRMKSRSDSPGFWVQERRSQEFPGRTYVPWKFPMNVQTKSSQLWIWLAGRCSNHVRAESARCRGRLRMITSSLVAPPS